MFAIYAFCREVDDIADEPGSVAGKRRQLAEWRREIDTLFAGRPTTAVTRALGPAVRRYALRREDFLAVIEGMETDAADRLRFPDMAALHRYCDRVACAVGRLSVRVLGEDTEAGQDLASSLGEALQLANILRDIKEDASRDRLYLPAELLRDHGIEDARDVTDILSHPALPAACEHLAAMANQRFAEAESALARCDRRRVRPAAVMMRVYQQVLRLLARRGWTRLDEPVRVSRLAKLWIAFRHGFL